MSSCSNDASKGSSGASGGSNDASGGSDDACGTEGRRARMQPCWQVKAEEGRERGGGEGGRAGGDERRVEKVKHSVGRVKQRSEGV